MELTNDDAMLQIPKANISCVASTVLPSAEIYSLCQLGINNGDVFYLQKIFAKATFSKIANKGTTITAEPKKLLISTNPMVSLPTVAWKGGKPKLGIPGFTSPWIYEINMIELLRYEVGLGNKAGL